MSGFSVGFRMWSVGWRRDRCRREKVVLMLRLKLAMESDHLNDGLECFDVCL